MITQVNYINAHATSTLVGDIAEVKAVKKVFTDTKHIKMNATKSLIGHCLVRCRVYVGFMSTSG